MTNRASRENSNLAPDASGVACGNGAALSIGTVQQSDGASTIRLASSGGKGTITAMSKSNVALSVWSRLIPATVPCDGNEMPAPPSFVWLDGGRRIEAYKLYREKTGCTLKESKEEVDRIIHLEYPHLLDPYPQLEPLD